MNVKESIENKVRQGLSPSHLEVVDESHKHEGHAGAKPGGETHFAVLVVAEKFAGKSRMERQREVFTILKDEMAGRVHALRFIGLYTEEEYKKKL